MLVRLFVAMSISVVFAWMYDNVKIVYKHKVQNNCLFYFLLLTLLICFNGFREAYNDTWNYRDIYTYLIKPFPEAWESFSWKLGDSPLYNIVVSWLKTYDVDVHLYLMFFGFWTVLIYTWFIKKYSKGYFAFTVFLYFTSGCYLFTLAAIKQCIATAFCLIATYFFINKKYLFYFGFIIIGILLHPYSIIYLILPFLTFKPWTCKSLWLILLIVFAGIFFQPLLGTIIDITALIGESYTESTFAGEGVGWIRIIVYLAPVVLSYLYRDRLYKDNNRPMYIFSNVLLLYLGILFVGRFGTALYFGRLSNYFAPLVVLAISWMLQKINDKKIITISAILYTIYFYFLNTLETQFETSYQALTAKEFLDILVRTFD